MSWFVTRDVLGERLDEERLADHDFVDRLSEQLRKPRHMDALLVRIQVDGARNRRRKGLLAAVMADPDRLLDARDPGPGQTELDFRQRCLKVFGKTTRRC